MIYFEIRDKLSKKATNEQKRKTKKQKLIDTDNSMVVTRRKGAEGVAKGKVVKYMVTKELTWGCGHAMQRTSEVL